MTKLSSVYAQSLFELAVESGNSKEILEGCMQVINIAEENPQLKDLLSAPVLSKEEKLSVIDSVFSGNIAPVLLNFIKVMTERKDSLILEDSLKEYEKLYNDRNGIEKAVAITAVPMNQPMLAGLKEKLEKITGKTIILTNKVDPSCIGGVILQLNGQQHDSSIAGKLADLNKQLKQ